MISKYLDYINQRYKLGNATEHTFRGYSQQLIENLVPEICATNESKHQKCDAPDYIRFLFYHDGPLVTTIALIETDRSMNEIDKISFE